MTRAELRRIAGIAAPEWKALALGSLALIVGAATTLVYPQALRILVDAIVRDGEASASFARAGLLMFGAFLLQAAASALRTWLFSAAGERITARLKRQLFGAFLQREIAFFDQHTTGELLNRLSQDTAQLQAATTASLASMLQHGAAVVGGLTILAVTNAELTLVCLPFAPVLIGGALLHGRRTRALSRAAQDALARCGAIAQEALFGIRTVRQLAQEPFERARYGEAMGALTRLAERRALEAGLFAGFAACAGYGALGLTSWYGARLVATQALSVGELTAFLIYTVLIATAIAPLSSAYAGLMRAVGASQRVFELLEAAPDEGGDAAMPGEAVLTGPVVFDAVWFAYPSRANAPVVSNLDLRIEPGQTIALVGPSGAGKSTLAHLLTRLYPPDAGAITIGGVDIQGVPRAQLARSIGIVSQDAVLFSGTIAENIRYGSAHASQAEVLWAARAANAQEFIERIPGGLEARVGERGVCLSGGQRQRIAIARVLLKNPPLLILDEATSALDAESEALVRDALETLMHGRTTLVIAHRLDTVRRADRLLVLSGGRIVEAGTHTELMARRGLYHRLVERQLTGPGPAARGVPGERDTQ